MNEDDKLSFLDQPRDETGRFASKADTQPAPEPLASEPPPAPEPQGETPPVQDQEASNGQPSAGNVQPPPGYIPMAALLDERDKRQKYERELETYRKQAEEARRAPPPAPIDPITDPEGFEASINQRLEKARWDAITSVSHSMATRHHGADKVKAAEEWLAGELQNNPHLWQTVQRQVDPYDFVVQQHQRTLRLAKIGDDDPESWAEKWAAQNGYVKADQQHQAASGGAAPSPTQTPLPKPSLATARSAGGTAPRVPMGPGSAFDGVFKS